MQREQNGCLMPAAPNQSLAFVICVDTWSNHRLHHGGGRSGQRQRWFVLWIPWPSELCRGCRAYGCWGPAQMSCHTQGTKHPTSGQCLESLDSLQRKHGILYLTQPLSAQFDTNTEWMTCNAKLAMIEQESPVGFSLGPALGCPTTKQWQRGCRVAREQELLSVPTHKLN